MSLILTLNCISIYFILSSLEGLTIIEVSYLREEYIMCFNCLLFQLAPGNHFIFRGFIWGRFVPAS